MSIIAKGEIQTFEFMGVIKGSDFLHLVMGAVVFLSECEWGERED